MKKLNLTIGRFQPFTQGHLNMVNEGEAPCVVYRINSSNKTIERKKKGIKIASKSWTDESVNKVIEYIDNPTSDLTEQEKELLKRPFTNELIDKELEIVKKSNKNIIDVVPVVNVYDALGKYNQFLTEHSDEYEVGDWMCGDDRKDNYEKNIEGLAKYTELEVEFKSGKTLPNILIDKLKVNTGKGRTDGVSGTEVRKAILNKDKAAFEKIMPKGVGSLFNDFTKAFDDFKVQLQNIIKEHKTMTLKDYIFEKLKINSKSKVNLYAGVNKLKKELEFLIKNADDDLFLKAQKDNPDRMHTTKYSSINSIFNDLKKNNFYSNYSAFNDLLVILKYNKKIDDTIIDALKDDGDYFDDMIEFCKQMIERYQ